MADEASSQHRTINPWPSSNWPLPMVWMGNTNQQSNYWKRLRRTTRMIKPEGYLTPLEFETVWRLAHPDQTTL